MYIKYFTEEKSEKFKEIVSAAQSLRKALNSGDQRGIDLGLALLRRAYRLSERPITARPLYLVGVENNGSDKTMSELFPIILKRYKDEPDRKMTHVDMIHFTEMCPLLQTVEQFPSKWDRGDTLRVISTPCIMSLEEDAVTLSKLSGTYWEPFYEALLSEGNNDRLLEAVSILAKDYIGSEESGFIGHIALERSDGYFIRIVPGSIIKVNLKTEQGETIDLFEEDGELNKSFKEFILSKFPLVN